MFSRFSTFVILAWSALSALAAITITAPSPEYWWIAESQNLFSWTCGPNYNEGYTNFTVIVTNDDVKVLSGPLALVAIQWDYQCSVLMTTDTTLPAGPGYQLSFADAFNMTHILASSQKFEIKPKGSAFAPTPSTTPAGASATGSVASGTGSAATTTATSTNAGVMNTASWTIFGTILAIVGALVMQ